MNWFILLCMLFAHVVDDYYLQGILAQMKQKAWWKDYARFYRYDYIAALVAHAFSWSFMIMLPIMWHYGWALQPRFLGAYLVNMIIHAFIDNLKANKYSINLVQDQCIHVLQIILTWILLVG